MATILMISNDPVITELFETNLSKTGYVTVSAINGLEGLKILNCLAFDLVITEMHMLEVDGYDVIMNLKMKSDCPCIIAMFDRDMLPDIASWLDMTNYIGVKTLSKPFTINELLKCVQESLAYN